MENNTKAILLLGKSSAGKDTIYRKLLENSDLVPVVSCTSRPKRDGETEGKDYFYLSKKEFLQGIKNNDFIEYRSYDTLVQNKPDTWYYGVKKDKINANKINLLVIEIQGAKAIIDYLGKENCQVIYIKCDEDVRTRRAMLRGSFDLTEWNRRALDDKKKFTAIEENKEKGIDCHIIDNSGDCIELAIDEIKKIIH